MNRYPLSGIVYETETRMSIHSFRDRLHHPEFTYSFGMVRTTGSAKYNGMLLPLPLRSFSFAFVAIDSQIRPRAFASLQNSLRIRAAFSREREQSGWLRSCLSDLLRCRNNGISVVTAPRVLREYAR